ncbi:hypothetical protein ACEQ8H_008569 [Pleosporales sp. CAS-2024a]
MEESLRRLGYTQGRKPSHAHTDHGEAPVPPRWQSRSPAAAHDSLVHAQPYCIARDYARTDNHSPHQFLFATGSHASRPSPPASAHPAHVHPSPLHLPSVGSMASSAPRRFAGDGFDFRRPAGAAAREQTMDPIALGAGGGDDGDDDDMRINRSRDEDVIDLTADDSGYGASQDSGRRRRTNDGEEQPRGRINGPQRLPRGMDIIIDLDNGREEWRMATPPAQAAEHNSPEIQFISSRTIDAPFGGRHGSDADEVEFVRANALPQDEVRRRQDREVARQIDLIGGMQDMHGRFVHLQRHIERFNARMNREAADLRRGGPVAPPRGAPRARGHVHIDFAAPMLDFDMIGFDLGGGAAQRAPPPPTYTAPNAAPEGFTRSPQEDGALICPNCEEELCVGDDETKRQVWIVKACGHVYCGECTANRSSKKSNKGKERPPRTKPFAKCVVEDCDKKVSHSKAMFQIFL